MLKGSARPFFGAQGWEYLDLGRFWQILLIVGMLLWIVIMYRGLRPRLATDSRGNLPYVFFYSALSIPLLCRRAGVQLAVHVRDRRLLAVLGRPPVGRGLPGTVHHDPRRVHLRAARSGVEKTALRVIYFDAILYSVGGVVGTMHHFYFSGGPAEHMAQSAGAIPLTFLTVEAWTFLHMGARQQVIGGQGQFPHRWAVMFLVSVGFWNFSGPASSDS